MVFYINLYPFIKIKITQHFFISLENPSGVFFGISGLRLLFTT